MLNVTIPRELLYKFTELLEDTVAYSCDELMLSGEAAWTVLYCLSEAKLREFNN